MIEKFNFTRTTYSKVLNIIKENSKKDDFYFTLNNQRIFVNNLKVLQQFFRISHDIFYVNYEKSGIILIWKSLGGNKIRKYVKILVDNPDTARDLITVLLWHYKKELYMKIKKDSNLINVFRSKGFRFLAGRGTEILLYKSEMKYGNKQHITNKT